MKYIITLIKLTALVILCIFQTECKKQNQSHNIETIDIESNIGSFSDMTISQFNPDIRYIKIETRQDAVLNMIRYIDFNDSYLLISDMKKCLVCDYKGKIVNIYSAGGNGPTEFQRISNAGFGLKGTVYILSSNILFEFDLKGFLIQKNNLNKNNDPQFNRPSWKLLNDSLIFSSTHSIFGTDRIKALIFDSKGNIFRKYRNFSTGVYDKDSFRMNDFMSSIFYLGGKLHFKERMNDTLFILDENLELKPKYYFKIGKYSDTSEETETSSSQSKDSFDFIYVDNVLEIGDYLFLDCPFGKYFPAKRVTPKEMYGQLSWYNTTSALGIYNLKDKSLLFCKPSISDNPLFATGLLNDIDAGPRFFPKKQVNDSTLLMWVTSKELIDHVSSNDFKTNIPKNPEKKMELQEFTKDLSELDNPVIMMVTFKNGRD